jgi:putative tryptophan/tyrosine transport system substrate-binding protein
VRRREVFGLVLLATIRRAQAQGLPKVFRIGVVSPINLRSAPQFLAFEDRLREVGYVEGRNLTIEFLYLEGRLERYPEAMAELLRRQVDVVIAGGQEAALKAAKEATSTIPVVVVAIDYDPLARGYIASLAQPGGNVTGVVLNQIELTGKRLELLKEAAPSATRILVLWDAVSADQFLATRTVAAKLNLPLVSLELRDPPYDYALAFAGADGERGDALLAMTSPFFFRDRARLADLALQHRLPSVFVLREHTDAGGLMSYAPSLTGMYRRAADYVDRIAKGAKPVDLPVEQPTHFELVINLKTARALSLSIPPTLLARADEVIE